MFSYSPTLKELLSDAISPLSFVAKHSYVPAWKNLTSQINKTALFVTLNVCTKSGRTIVPLNVHCHSITGELLVQISVSLAPKSTSVLASLFRIAWKSSEAIMKKNYKLNIHVHTYTHINSYVQQSQEFPTLQIDLLTLPDMYINPNHSIVCLWILTLTHH